MTRVHQKTLLATAVITALAAPLAQAELEEAQPLLEEGEEQLGAMSTCSNRTKNHESLPASSSQE